MNPFFSCLTIALTLGASTLLAAPPRALPVGQLPKDIRLEPLKDLNGYFPFTPPVTTEDWSRRSAEIRTNLLVSLGLFPMPTRHALNPVIHGRIDRGDYTVEKVYFESWPGFYVTGNLYRPKAKGGRHPGVLFPHGHWDNGRFYDLGPDGIKQEVASGSEKYMEGGRSLLQALPVQLARMGCIVFQYDMLGYADSQQISMGVAHQFSKQRPEMNTVENWGLFSPQAEAHLQSIMGLQTWNSIRALDFLETIPEIDQTRIGVTGASGGGTQTFILAAIDPRPAAIFPAVMVSTGMQGGCTCENASLLRVHAGNVEIAGVFAPKPMAMTAADDWTKEMSSKGYPELQKLYQLLGYRENVHLAAHLQFGHNYNYPSRADMYQWLNRHLRIGAPEPIVEPDYQRLSREEMTVWDPQHPQPASGADFERRLLREMHDDSQKSLANDRTLSVARNAWSVLIGRNYDSAGTVEWNRTAKVDRGSFIEMPGTLRNTTYAEEVPVLFLYPKNWNGSTVLFLHPEGKSGIYLGDGSLRPEVQKSLDEGSTVAGIDLLSQGEFLATNETFTTTRKVNNPREAPSYTFGYNASVFSQRVHDILTFVRYVRTQHEPPTKKLSLVALDGTTPLAAAALALPRTPVDASVLPPTDFRFGQLLDYRSPQFLPGAAKYGDVPMLLRLAKTASGK